MKVLKLTMFAVALIGMSFATLDMANAQRGRGGWGGGGDSLLNLLGNEKVQNELGFVDDQAEQVQELQDEFREEMRYMFEDMRNGGGGDREQMWQTMREKMGDLNKDFNSKVEELLIDDQMSRLKQLQNQARMRGGVTRALEGSLGEELGITEDQLEAMREKAEEIQDWTREEMEKIRKKAQDKVLEVLDPEQRDKIKEMIGESFDFGQQQRGWGGQQRGGDRGGRERGGDRGGDQGGRPRSDF